MMDIAWPGAAPHQVVNAVQGVASKTGCSASWRALWDPQYLYVFVEVNDVELYHDGPATYQDDSVEVFIDIHNDKATSYGTDDYQYRFNWDAKTPAIAMDHGSTTDGIDFAILTTDTGYAFESRFPWTLLYQNQGGPSLGDPMGFEVQINDDDDGGDRDNQIDWYTTSNNTWQNPSLMGTVELVQGAAAPVNASNPKPSNEAKGVWVDTLLTWISGMYADKHDVYFGTDYNDIYDATATSPLLVSNSQSDTTYDPPGLLAFGQTYYWRIDEVNATPDAFVYEGGVWSFTTETYGFYVKPINATASSSQSTTQTGPLKTIDRSGLNSNDQHSTTLTHMWLSKSGQTPVWIQYEFDQVYNLYQMWVWNQNQLTEPDKGYGAKDVTVETSTDGTSWTALANVPQFAQATAADTYVHNTTVDFGGVGAKFVRLNILSNWGGAKQSGLAEVQFSYIPVKAFGPTPVPGTPEVATDRVLTWRPGRKAVSHEVYLGTDPSALSKVGTVTEQRYDLSAAGVEYDRTYYWRVDEVNGTDTWAGDVWSFSTPGYAIVDDFESYNDECKRIFFSWSDGTGHSGSVDCGVAPASGNGTGSTVGKADAPYAERDNVHSGAQAMPFSYDNTSGSGVSEATQTFDPPQDWTQSGVKTLVLFFRGDPANGAGQVYLKINGTQVTYHGSASPLTTGLWNQWNVDLSSLSVQAVSSLTIGVSGTGKGVLYVDDIRLYRQAPAATAVPTDPGTGALVAYYACEGDAKDTSGKAHDGTPMNDPAFADSRAGLGKALWLDGINDHVELPIGNLISTLTSATLSAWFNLDTTSTGSWVRVFDFGVGVTSGNPFIYMFLSPRQSMNGAMRFAITTGSNTAESGVNSPRPVSAGWHHVAVVMDGTAKTLQLILDGEVVASGPTAVLPRDLGVTTQNWLGRSQWSGDGYYQGQIDEFRIYDRALTAGEVRYLAGDR
ncbi:MAG: discoidin domain-containing protein [Phycisphaerae bacterium]|nr:discoidin domain-containing protein [Phycisphaerae bacterium]